MGQFSEIWAVDFTTDAVPPPVSVRLNYKGEAAPDAAQKDILINGAASAFGYDPTLIIFYEYLIETEEEETAGALVEED